MPSEEPLMTQTGTGKLVKAVKAIRQNRKPIAEVGRVDQDLAEPNRCC